MTGTWLLTVLLSGYSSLGAIVSALIAPFYVWWFKTAVHLPGSDALLPDPDAASRQYPAPVAGQEGKIWGKFRKKKTTRMRITATSRKTNNRRAGLSALCFNTAGSSASGQRGRTETLSSGLAPLFSRTMPA